MARRRGKPAELKPAPQYLDPSTQEFVAYMEFSSAYGLTDLDEIGRMVKLGVLELAHTLAGPELLLAEGLTLDEARLAARAYWRLEEAR